MGYPGMIYDLDFTGTRFDDLAGVSSVHSTIATGASKSIDNENKR